MSAPGHVPGPGLFEHFEHEGACGCSVMSIGRFEAREITPGLVPKVYFFKVLGQT